MRLITVFFLLTISLFNSLISQEIRKYSDAETYARGILLVNDTIYTSNANGTVCRFSWDNKFKDSTIYLGNEELRDIECANGQLFVMESGKKGVVHRISKSEHDTLSNLLSLAPNVFFDGMDSYKSTIFLMGDPIYDTFSVFVSKDAGLNWETVNVPMAIQGEAGFAASGTNVQVLNDSTYLFVTGGRSSRFFKTTSWGQSWEVSDMPFPNCSNSTGAFSMHMKNADFGIIVGGNYEDPKNKEYNCFITEDGGETWKVPFSNPNGYRSCVLEKNGVWYCCGTTGLDYSIDHGMNWKMLSSNEFFALTTDNQFIYATARNGQLYRFKLIENDTND